MAKDIIKDLTMALSELISSESNQKYVLAALKEKLVGINEDLSDLVYLISDSAELSTEEKLKFLATKAEIIDCLNILERY